MAGIAVRQQLPQSHRPPTVVGGGGPADSSPNPNPTNSLPRPAVPIPTRPRSSSATRSQQSGCHQQPSTANRTSIIGRTSSSSSNRTAVGSQRPTSTSISGHSKKPVGLTKDHRASNSTATSDSAYTSDDDFFPPPPPYNVVMGIGVDAVPNGRGTTISTTSRTATAGEDNITSSAMKALRVDGSSPEEKAMQRKQRLQLLRLQAEQRVKGKREQQNRDNT